MLKDVSDELFVFLWRLFDSDGSGYVDADEFTVAMALLSSDVTSGAASTEAQLEAVFFMFDADHSGDLAMEEFEAMVQATVQLNLGHLLHEEAFKDQFSKALESEYSSENLDFWQAVREYQGLTSGVERLARAKVLHETYIAEGAVSQVNIASGTQKSLGQALHECSTEAPTSLFDAASDEIFKLMERDTFSRFKRDPEAIRSLLSSYHAAAGAGKSTVSFAAFKAWALREPTVLIFFTGLCHSIRGLLAEHGGEAVASGTNSPPPPPLLPAAGSKPKGTILGRLRRLAPTPPGTPKAKPASV